MATSYVSAATLTWDAPLAREDGTTITGELSYIITNNGTPAGETKAHTFDLDVATGDEVCVAAREITGFSDAISDSTCGIVPAKPKPPTRLRFEWVQSVEIGN